MAGQFIEARLAGFSYGPPGHRAGSDPNAERATLAVRAAAAEVLAIERGRPAAKSQHAAGVAALALQSHGQAIEYLEKAVAIEPTSAWYWSDLAVARYELARARHEPQTLVDALVAADASLQRQGDFPPALYNRALILEALHQREHARDAYTGYLRIESTSAWSTEAKRRIQNLRVGATHSWKSTVPRLRQAVSSRDFVQVERIVAEFPQDSRSWGEAVFLQEWAAGSASADAGLDVARAVAHVLQRRNGESLLADAVAAIDAATPSQTSALRKAHDMYMAAGNLYAARHVSDALPGFQRAADQFRRGQSPMAIAAEYYVASCFYDLNRGDEALRKLDDLVAHTPGRYKALHGLLLWERGTVFAREGRLHEALASQVASLAAFERLDENHNAIFMSNAAAATLALLGRNAEAWRMREVVFQRLAATEKRDYEQIALDAAARTEALGSRWDRASSLLTLAIHPQITVNRRIAVSSQVWRALAGLRTKAINPGVAAAEAQRIALSVPDPHLRRSATGDALFARAVVTRATGRSREAISLLSQYIVDARDRRDPLLLAEAFLERARAHRALNDAESAVADLTEAMQWIDARRGNAEQDEYRDAFFSTDDSIRRELVDVWDRGGEAQKAFDILRSRDHQGAGDRMHPVSPPPTLLLVEYVALDDRLLIFLMDSRGLKIIRSNATRFDLSRNVNELSARIVAGRDSETIDSRRQLSLLLLEPARDWIQRSATIVIVADPVLAGVPFAALPFGRPGKLLIESTTIVIAPYTPYRAAHNRASSEALLSVGNPTIDSTVFNGMPTLAAAEREAKDIAAAAGTVALIGAHATKNTVLERLQTATVAHLATHAFVDAADATRSFLLFASSPGDSGTLNVREIERLQLPDLRLVVLAGCRTGASVSETANANVTSLASAFIYAGADDVIGALWDVGDDPTQSVVSAFYRGIHRGMTPAAALRDAQISMLQSPRPAERQLVAWSGFRAYSAVWPAQATNTAK